MKKVDPTILKETSYIAALTLVLSLLMQSAFLIAGMWDITVLLGNLLGIVAAVGNFFLMGLTVQSALGREEKQIKNLVRLSQTGRMLMLFAVALIGHLLPCFNLLAVIIPYIFPRLAVTARPILVKDSKR